MRISLLVLTASIATLTACRSTDSMDPSSAGPAGGKADGVRSCAAGVNCLQFASYEVLFTNPLCNAYAYEESVTDLEGDGLQAKPKNVYCRDTHDRTLNYDGSSGTNRLSSPKTRVIDWIDDTDDGDAIFLAYLSFSDEDVFGELCDASERGVEVTFVVDRLEDGSAADALLDCGADVLVRGGGKILFAHNKLLMVNPDGPGPDGDDEAFMRISFGSGNMSTGTYLHHENWHFLEVARDSYFVEAHKCLRDSLLAHDPGSDGDGKTEFRNRMNDCRDAIEFEEEDDMKAYFVPVLEDRRKQQKLMRALIEASPALDIGVHRIGSKTIVDPLSARLRDDADPVRIRMIADDDLFWRNPVAPATFVEEGFNGPGDVRAVQDLEDADTAADGARRGRFEQRFMETATRQFHHNKFIAFHDIAGLEDAIAADSEHRVDVALVHDAGAVMMGAANLTGTGFNDNFENNYITSIPQVVEAFEVQFRLLWGGEGPLPEGHRVAPQATAIEDMPRRLVHVTEPSESTQPPPARDCGLRIVEFLPNATGSDAGREWVKLYNSCPDPQSLEGTSLSWGGAAYSRGRSVGLSGLEPLDGRSCLVVGGSISDESNGSPVIDVEATFSPGLQNGGDDADAIGLFGVARSELDGRSLPIDAVIYGGPSNGNGLVDHTGDVPEPDHASRPGEGESYRLVDGQWRLGEPRPDDCPQF
jgi:hypothetical protein